MQHLVSFLFIIEFLLVLLIFFYILLKEGVNFKVGISFALMFFIFIPVWVMILTGRVELSMTDFGSTQIDHVILKQNIKTSFILLSFIFSIIIYLYFPSLKNKQKIKEVFNPSIKTYFIIYLSGMSFIFIGSGLLGGGNWYDNRHNFFESYGAIALLIAFVLNSSKILIIASLTYKWLEKKMGFIKFLIFIGSFTVLDMVFSGNRIYLFCTFVMISLIYLKRFPKKIFLLTPVIIPCIFVFGYFASIFKHMRGPLFYKGFPTIQVFVASLARAISLEPPKPILFFLGISESVNVNVIYNLFNSFDKFLYGTTYLKPMFFYLPRSIWVNKPESITIIAAKTYGGASLVTTIIGEMYMNFYLLGIVFLPIFFWFTDNILTYSLKGYGNFTKLIMFIIGLLIFRMPFSDEFLVFIFLILILNFTNRFKNIKFKINKNVFKKN